MSVLIRGSNELVVGEADRSLHDALCVVRSIVKKRFLLAGGGAPEIELSRRLNAYAKTLPGMDSYCLKAYAEALEVIPYVRTGREREKSVPCTVYAVLCGVVLVGV